MSVRRREFIAGLGGAAAWPLGRSRTAASDASMQLCRGLHAAGMRFRLHSKGMPGKPDIVLRRHRAVISDTRLLYAGSRLQGAMWGVA
jgi:hypothetical protein